MGFDELKLFLTVLLAIAGWMIAGWIHARRDNNNKRREIVVNHLIESYKILTQEIGHRDTSIESMTKLENLLSEIQLFGNAKQIELAREISNQTATEGVSKIDPLIENLRNSLRKELKLEVVEGSTIWLRFTENYKNNCTIGDKG